ncbi:MAG: Coenzyme F420 hydrogenase/dehydrogenase, beta subunit C-terminal domain [Candidatus Hodarchaeota archaeon]
MESNIENLKDQLKEKNRASFGSLRKRVIEPGLCMECGKCVALCDVIDWDPESRAPKLVGKCTACKLCYYQCPITPGSPIGDFISALVTRTKLDEVSGQDGGTITTMLLHLLETGKNEAAILTKNDPDKPWHPQPFIATTKEEVLSASGSIYSHSPVIPVLVQALKKGYKKLAVVTTPCKITSITELLDGEVGLLKGLGDVSILKIGLFCSEAFIPEKLLSLFEGELDPARVTKMKISNGVLRVHSPEGKVSIPLHASEEELRNATKKSCLNCHDFAAEDADISVGNIGSDSKHNTVLVRSKAGQEIIDAMVDKGIIESRPASKEEINAIIDLAWKKKERALVKDEIPFKPGKFKEHEPASWDIDDYDYTPEVHTELYKRLPYEERVVNSNPSGSKVLLAKVPEGTKEEITTHNYTTSYDLTHQLLKDYPKIKGGKVFLKPNNTGFVGIFGHNPKLKAILDKNLITDDADHQPIATQPASVQGIVDAMLDLGAKKIHIGENMLWEGGTQRAFYETGYTVIFSKEKYKGKVYFIDYCEDDPPPSEYKKLQIKKGKYDISDYYTKFYPPRAFFDEKYDLVFLAALAKSHNCSYYTIITKNFSVSLNPRKKTGKIEPRWHIHGVPIDVFRKDYLKNLLGQDFKRKFQYLLRETYRHEWDANLKEKIVKPKKSRVILSGRQTTRLAKSIPATLHSSGLMKWFKSYGKMVLNVDPHHWAGINLLTMNLGMGYLITRFTGMYAAMVDVLKENGTDVAGFVSGIAGQENDGPLIYGNTKYGGFAVAGWDAVATEKVCLDLMYGVDGDFQKAIMDYQEGLMKKFGIENDELLGEARRMWTLELLAELTGGVLDNGKMDITLLDYTGTDEFKDIKPGDLYKLRIGTPFEFSEAFYCSPNTWLKLAHTDENLFKNAFWFSLKSIEIPLIPGVVE